MLRGAGSKRDRRTHAYRPEENGECPLCAGQVALRPLGRAGNATRRWSCLCGAQGVTRKDGELALLSAPKIPRPQTRYRMDGTERTDAD